MADLQGKRAALERTLGAAHQAGRPWGPRAPQRDPECSIRVIEWWPGSLPPASVPSWSTVGPCVNATVATASTLRDTADCGALVRAETSGKHTDESKTATARAAQSVWVAVEQDMAGCFPLMS